MQYNYLLIDYKKRSIQNVFTKSRHTINKEICDFPSILVADCINSNTMPHKTFKTYVRHLYQTPHKVKNNVSIDLPHWVMDYKEFLELYIHSTYEKKFMHKSIVDIQSLNATKTINVTGKIWSAILLLDTTFASLMSKHTTAFDLRSVHYKYKRNNTLIYAHTHCNDKIIIPDLGNKMFITPDFKTSELFQKVSGIKFENYSKTESITYTNLIKLFNSSINVIFIDKKGQRLEHINIPKYLTDQDKIDKKLLIAMIAANRKNKNMFVYEDVVYLYDSIEFDKNREKIMYYVLDDDMNETIAILKKAKGIPKTPDSGLMNELQNMGFNATPFDHQDIGISWLTKLYKNNLPGAILGDDMGLGKTLQAIAFLVLIKAQKIVIISPASVVGVWKGEIAKFYPKLINNVQIFSYESIRSKGLDGNYDVIILDEGQKVKNPATLAAGILRGAKAKFKLIMTGTPIENKIDDLFSLILIIMPNSKRLLREIMNKHAKSQIQGITLTRSLIDGLYISRKMTSKQLPVKLTKVQNRVTLSDEERKIYDHIIEYYSKELKSIDNNSAYYRAAIVGLMRVIQAISYSKQLPPEILPEGITPSQFSKVRSLEKIISKTEANGEKIVVFARFTETIKYIKSLYGDRALVIKGDVAKGDRDTIVAKFQKDPKYSIIIISLQAGATGLTLTAANNLAFIDLWWNPAIMEQASRRIYRIGQTKDCKIHYITAADTIDDSILKILLSKTELMNALDKNVKDTESTSISKDLINDVFG